MNVHEWIEELTRVNRCLLSQYGEIRDVSNPGRSNKGFTQNHSENIRSARNNLEYTLFDFDTTEKKEFYTLTIFRAHTGHSCNSTSKIKTEKKVIT